MRSRAEQAWQEVSRILVANSAANLTDASPRLAILAAHPDDETIGASVLLARFPDTAVIFLTDGAPRDSSLWSPDCPGSREKYAALRRSEAEHAVGLAGLPPDRIHWLGAVDQEAVFSAGELSKTLADLLGNLRMDVLVTHPYEGGHPDHDAAALVARLALGQVPADKNPLLMEMTSYHAQNGECVTEQFLSGDPQAVINIDLSATERARKQQTFAAYSSQRMVLSAFGTEYEHFRLAPAYDFSRPPHEGKLWYECMGWPITGEKWRQIAVRAIAGMQEYACR